jgi:hypothetical protein
MNISIGNISQIALKIRQAHWRVQRQWIGLFLLGLVAVSMVAGIYLNVTVRATLAGREIQLLQPNLTNGREKNSDLEMQLAGLNSIESMQKRAEAMGFQPTNPDDITFVLVPGYTPQTPVDMSQPAPAIPGQTEKPMLLPE